MQTKGRRGNKIENKTYSDPVRRPGSRRHILRRLPAKQIGEGEVHQSGDTAPGDKREAEDEASPEKTPVPAKNKKSRKEATAVEGEGPFLFQYGKLRR